MQTCTAKVLDDSIFFLLNLTQELKSAACNTRVQEQKSMFNIFYHSVMQITEKCVWLRSVVCNCNCNVCVMWMKLLLIMPFLTQCHICCPWWLICPCAGVLLLISSCLAFHVHMWNVEEVSEHSHATKYKLQQMEILILFWLTALADIFGGEEVSQIFLNYSFSALHISTDGDLSICRNHPQTVQQFYVLTKKTDIYRCFRLCNLFWFFVCFFDFVLCWNPL